MVVTPQEVTLRSLGPSVFLPVLIFEIGSGAIAPVIVLSATGLGASAGTAAFMLALLGVGRLIGDIPASMLAGKVGERQSMLLAAALAFVSYFACLIAPSLHVLGPALMALGASNSTFNLARQSYLIDAAPVRLRARAMSTMSGSHRIGLFVGPFLGAAAISLSDVRGAYVVAMISALATILLLLVVAAADVPEDQPRATRRAPGSRGVVTTYWRLFATLGLAVLALGAVRSARQAVLPLWADHLHLNPETISVVFGIASGVEMLLFYPSGKVMDEYGRLAVALPATTILGVSMMLLPLTDGVLSLTIVAMLMGVGNGIGSGIMMTLGADAAPTDGRLRFLGVWRLLGDSGNAAGPVAVSVGALLWSLAGGIAVVGSWGLFAAVALAIWTPRYSPYATRGSTRAHRRGEQQHGG